VLSELRHSTGPTQLQALTGILVMVTGCLAVPARRHKRAVAAVVAVGAIVALAGAVSVHRARGIADRIAGVSAGIAVPRPAQLARLQRPGWAERRWVWLFNYDGTAPGYDRQAQVYVSPTGRWVDQYNVASLGPPPPNDR
jgi:hypothetical protein